MRPRAPAGRRVRGPTRTRAHWRLERCAKDAASSLRLRQASCARSLGAAVCAVAKAPGPDFAERVHRTGSAAASTRFGVTEPRLTVRKLVTVVARRAWGRQLKSPAEMSRDSTLKAN